MIADRYKNSQVKEEPAVHEQACNHGSRGCQIIKMAHSKKQQRQQQHKPWLFSFWSIQLNYNDECLMQITEDIPSNIQYSSHRGRQSYQLIITRCSAMLPFWSMSNRISLNQLKHFRAYWTQTNVITTRSLERHFCQPVAIKTKLNTGVSIQANKLDLATSYVTRLQHRTAICAISLVVKT